ncbi:MAG: hypothetical protein SF052_06345 [Bacteroidia bacterium]|nr:hypothetical protein [Bacteroidia bacterium]
MEQIAEILGEVLKYTVPAVLVLLAVKLTQDYHSRQIRSRNSHSLRKSVIRTHLPLKLAAYERAVLFLERISPENLIPRINATGKTVGQLERELVNEITSEYEHNLVQQLYISYSGWSGLVMAKNEMLQTIRQAASELPREEKGLILSQKIIEICANREEQSTHKATFLLKSDVLKIFEIEGN